MYCSDPMTKTQTKFVSESLPSSTALTALPAASAVGASESSLH
jgi:hypothetical protein